MKKLCIYLCLLPMLFAAVSCSEKKTQQPPAASSEAVAPPDQNESALPWEKGGKLPNEYTWAEFEALSDEEEEAFFEWFDSSDSFVAWLNENRPAEESPAATEQPPMVLAWENGGKLPTEYTWAEFESLGDSEQEAFFEWFDSPESFEEWMNQAKQSAE